MKLWITIPTTMAIWTKSKLFQMISMYDMRSRIPNCSSFMLCFRYEGTRIDEAVDEVTDHNADYDNLD